MTDYHTFLESKRRTAQPVGRGVDLSDMHPSLFDHQTHIIRWALRRGRAAIFADTGLGKTAMQLEWARHIADTALILAPLSVARQTVREANRIRPVWYGIRESATLNAAAARENEDERHICPLQLPLIERCVRLWTNKGDTVLSPFAGIGSEGFVAVKQGREFIGCELKPSYWATGVENLKRAEYELNLPTLFDDE